MGQTIKERLDRLSNCRCPIHDTDLRKSRLNENFLCSESGCSIIVSRAPEDYDVFEIARGPEELIDHIFANEDPRETFTWMPKSGEWVHAGAGNPPDGFPVGSMWYNSESDETSIITEVVEGISKWMVLTSVGSKAVSPDHFFPTVSV